MSVVLDTGVVVALYDEDDAHHGDARRWMQTFDDELVTTPLAIAEMDHFAGRTDGRSALVRDLDVGAFAVRWWADALSETIAIARRHPHLGLTDASLVALAGRLRTSRIATFDHRHFRALTTPQGVPFTVLPADAH